jgi:hypothetical protein
MAERGRHAGCETKVGEHAVGRSNFALCIFAI